MTNARTPVTPAQRQEHARWLLDLTQLPTASGREQRVLAWIRRWCAERPDLALTEDDSGNLIISLRACSPEDRPTYFTAHLDHPAFVVERIIAPGTLELSFRGGVMDDYFVDARIRLFTRDDAACGATLSGQSPGAGGPFKHYLAVLDEGPHDFSVGDVGVWEMPPGAIEEGIVHSVACDDLAAAAAALSALDIFRSLPQASGRDIRLLFTRAEEIGFIGAIAACRHKTISPGARVIALENSRSFPESPIGGGPIVRVGDRLSVFSPSLTDAVAKRAEEIAGGAASPTASQKLKDQPAWKWQRKLMAGGACEASVFCHAGLEATCVCLPLGNYHNMANLAEVQAGTFVGRPRAACEFISLADYEGLVDLLIACAIRLPDGGTQNERFDKLWTERAFVLA